MCDAHTEQNPRAQSRGGKPVEEPACRLRAAFSHPKEPFVLGSWAFIFQLRAVRSRSLH